MEDNSKPKPTLEDVAKYCGVSIATVSRVINQSSPVSHELELRVRRAIKDVGFAPRQWKTYAATKTIMMVVPDILNPYYAEIINGAQEEADRQGVALVILNLSENPDLQKQHLGVVTRWMLDGLIVLGTTISPDFFAELRKQYNLPIVVSRSAESSQFPWIMPDYKTAIYQATRYLLSLNHKRIAYISGPVDWVSSKVRLKSFQLALREANLSLPQELYHWCYPNIEDGVQVVRDLLALPPAKRPTAILAFNDLIAIGALRTISMAGLKVPHDISVIGFDDIEMAAYTIPALTTVAQPSYRIGQLALKKLCDMMQAEGSVFSNTTLLECPLILRESTGPCPE
jgi:DNA-binding LacI/PurR family transcriptional regulator